MKKVERAERGWAGHFICADRCWFRRNTLLTCGDTRIVVSSVGLMENTGLIKSRDRFEATGANNRYYETMAFREVSDGRYWEASVLQKISFESPWSIHEVDADDKANDMHETVVAELTDKLRRGVLK